MEVLSLNKETWTARGSNYDLWLLSLRPMAPTQGYNEKQIASWMLRVVCRWSPRRQSAAHCRKVFLVSPSVS